MKNELAFEHDFMKIDFHPSDKVLLALGSTAKKYGLKAGTRLLQLAAKTKTTSAESGENKVSSVHG